MRKQAYHPPHIKEDLKGFPSLLEPRPKYQQEIYEDIKLIFHWVPEKN